MRVLAIDPGTNFGWAARPCMIEDAIGGKVGHIASGNTALVKQEPLRTMQFADALSVLIEKFRPEVIAIEMVHMKSAAQGKIIYGQLAMCRVLGGKNGATVLEIIASQWKKAMLSGGRASKEETMKTFACDNEHAADAIGVLMFTELHAEVE